MEQYSLKKGDFKSFVDKALKTYDFIAPVEANKSKQKSKSFFKKIDSVEQIFIDKKTYYPAKTFFFDPEEVLFEFDANKIIDPKISSKQKVFFGLRRCDLNGIMHQDTVFLDENTDTFYKARRDASILIGLHCKEGDDYCFCNSFELKDFFDLMFYDKGDIYAIEVGSEKGQKLVKKFKNLFKEEENIITEEDKKIINKKQLNTLDIKDKYDSEDWKKGADKCLACGACNFSCPNCHCFTIEDDVNFDLKTGKRVRKPASCQLRHFTRVAGDHVFRNEKVARFKHRIYHQIQYFKDRHDVVFCTGCGRCIEACPARIDWVDIINELK
jgi:sulfhydrogenase subunit beta (sulfur reductase)